MRVGSSMEVVAGTVAVLSGRVITQVAAEMTRYGHNLIHPECPLHQTARQAGQPLKLMHLLWCGFDDCSTLQLMALELSFSLLTYAFSMLHV
jgi:hypothetical protein